MEFEKTKSLTDYYQNIFKNDKQIKDNFVKNYSIEQLEKLDIFKTTKKLYERLKLVVLNENLYEADQLYKTIHFRCITNNLIDDGLNLLFNGIIFFSNKNSIQCAFDLSKAFMETLKKSTKTSLDQNLRIQIKLIHEFLGKCHSTSEEERAEFSVAVLKWSSSLFKKTKLDINDEQSIRLNYQNVFGHYEIHNDLAINYWKERNYVQARYHFLHSLDAKSFAYMVIECHLNFGFPSEYDLFLAQAVFQYLTLRNLKSAEEFFDTYTINHPMIEKSKINEKFFESPILNFIYFLIDTIKQRNKSEYKEIHKFYKQLIDKDSSYKMYLEKIEEYFFDIKHAKNERDGIFSNFMRMLTSAGTQNDSGSKPKSSRQRIDDSDQDDSQLVADLEDDDLLD